MVYILKKRFLIENIFLDAFRNAINIDNMLKKG